MQVAYLDYVITDNKTKLDIEVVSDLLSRSYWANERSRERIVKSIEGSVCYSVLHHDKQIGFARVVTDGATMYYLADVFISEDYRGEGIGKKLVEVIVNQQDYEGLTGILGTLDAHSLYEQYGFEREPERFMRRAAQEHSER
ncbi:GCN5-related N-acetyltransferase [Paenibacillus curdlanolyticus YK9]|uniref:GCN5-related N-acetyltransferase n=1 Tax=Paenibacillus curdlanolyticus YK9 TaxID=717606 RepID=E0I325_9BACL|nr:GNAT family N-acetyltransferase [Paenibacillus curdlanolyticus]EFM12689.1 GCN5-related N-acetyltransferase [Paenibacillus curdlanolyticus YK9]